MKYLFTLIVVLPVLVLAMGCPQPRKAGLADINYLRDNNPRQSTIKGSELSEPIDPSELDEALANRGRIRTTEDIIADNPALAEADAPGRTSGQHPPRPAGGSTIAPGKDEPVPAEDEPEPDTAESGGTVSSGSSPAADDGHAASADPAAPAQDSATATDTRRDATGPGVIPEAPEPPDTRLEPLPGLSSAASPLGNWCVAFRHDSAGMEQLNTINAETLEFRANGHFIWRKPLKEDWLKGSWESSGMSLNLMTAGGEQRALNLIMRDSGFMLLEDREADVITYCIRPADDFSMSSRLTREQVQPAGLELELAGPGRWRGTFLDGRGTVELRALGRYLVGTFRLSDDDSVAEGFILLEAVDEEWRAWWWDSETLRWPARL